MITNNKKEMKMKKAISFLLVVFSIVMLHSCSTTSQDVTIQGVPGTEIYSPEMQALGIIGQNSRLTLKISSKKYFPYLMSRNTGSNELVPFALDYKNHKYTGAIASAWIGCTAAWLGGTTAVVGAALKLGGGGDGYDTSMMAIGGGAFLLGASVGFPAYKRLDQKQYDCQYKYLPVQTTNQDIKFLPIKDDGYKKDASGEAHSSKSVSNKSDNPDGETTTVSRKRIVSTKHTIKNIGKLVAGTYTAKGSLKQNGDVIEEYVSIKINIQRIDNNNVYVDVLESGESFFNSKKQYSVKRNNNGYTLTMKGIPAATITIDVKGNISYHHPKVNIEGQIYLLEAKGTK